MKIDLTESEKTTLQGALVARYMIASRKMETLEEIQPGGIPVGYILAIAFFKI